MPIIEAIRSTRLRSPSLRGAVGAIADGINHGLAAPSPPACPKTSEVALAQLLAD